MSGGTAAAVMQMVDMEPQYKHRVSRVSQRGLARGAAAPRRLTNPAVTLVQAAANMCVCMQCSGVASARGGQGVVVVERHVRQLKAEDPTG
jgi:hypothetical protein